MFSLPKIVGADFTNSGSKCRKSEGSYTADMDHFSIGVDLGGTNLRIAAVEGDGKLLEKLTLGAEVKRGRDFVITEMCNAIQALRTKYRDSSELVGIGIGVPGFIDMAAGMVMESPNLPDWTSFPVRDEIEQRLVHLGKIAHLGWPVVHLDVDIQMVIAIPGRLDFLIPKALQVGRQPARA